jgi:hypothetical protein
MAISSQRKWCLQEFSTPQQREICFNGRYLGPETLLEEHGPMTILSAILIAWAICLMVFVGLVIYRSQLTRHEMDEVFLNDNVELEREIEHDDIVRRVDQIDPFLKTAGGVTALLTLSVIGIYVAQILPTVHF